jgi:hypothetical protein
MADEAERHAPIGGEDIEVLRKGSVTSLYDADDRGWTILSNATLHLIKPAEVGEVDDVIGADEAGGSQRDFASPIFHKYNLATPSLILDVDDSFTSELLK